MLNVARFPPSLLMICVGAVGLGDPAQGQSLPADVAFGPGFDQVMCDGNRRWHTQVRMVTPERREDVSTGEPPDIGHLFIVYVDISGQGAGVTTDHQ